MAPARGVLADFDLGADDGVRTEAGAGPAPRQSSFLPSAVGSYLSTPSTTVFTSRSWSVISAPARSALATPGGAESQAGSQGAHKPIARKSAAAQSKSGPAAKPKFERRDSVQHTSFGVGTVIESNITRDGEEVTVAFPGVGIKKLLAEYLRKL